MAIFYFAVFTVVDAKILWFGNVLFATERGSKGKKINWKGANGQGLNRRPIQPDTVADRDGNWEINRGDANIYLTRKDSPDAQPSRMGYRRHFMGRFRPRKPHPL